MSRAIELVGSMRFAVALLTILCIASIIGTVLPQGQAQPIYVSQFGPFWAQLFKELSLYQVYGSWWYLSILGFLILSTSLCVVKTTPKLFAEARGWKEHLRESSFRAFRLRDTILAEQHFPELVSVGAKVLRSNRYAVRVVDGRSGTLISAKKGSSSRWGFVFAHVGLVLIGVGALADGSFPIRVQMWLGAKRPAMTDAELAGNSQYSILSAKNPTFRGTVFVPEGEEVGRALLPLDDGLLVQDLPFRIRLNRFRVDYYSSGMPRLFVSDVTLINKQTGRTSTASIEVNKPFEMDGVMLYQSSFEDGGSQLKLRTIPTALQDSVMDLSGVAGRKLVVAKDDSKEPVSIELTEFKAINVEAVGDDSFDGRPRSSRWSGLVGSAMPSAHGDAKRNIGPTLAYTVRDAAGQGTEFLTVQQPMKVDGNKVFLFGVRKSGATGFQFVRVPADDSAEMTQWLMLRKAFADRRLRRMAVERYVASLHGGLSNETRGRLKEAAENAMTLFAGGGRGDKDGQRGLAALTGFIEATVPQNERVRVTRAVAEILQGTTLALWNVAREELGQVPAPADDHSLNFIALSLASLSDLASIDAPLLLSLTSYREVKASVFQVARAPGKYVVLFGSLALTAGIFLMFYLRTRRVFMWIPKGPDETVGRRRISIAMTSNRHSWDLTNDFEQLKGKFRAAVDSQE